MAQAQSNIIKMAAKSSSIENINFNDLVHPSRADDINFKSSLFEAVNILTELGIEKNVDLKQRFALAGFYHWLQKKKSLLHNVAKNVFNRLIKIYYDKSNKDHKSVVKLITLFQPNTEEESFSVSVFQNLKEHLNLYDRVEVIRGLDSFFNLAIQRHFDSHSNYNLSKLALFIKSFSNNLESEIKNKSEMSFMSFNSSDDDTITLTTSEVYRAFLLSLEKIYFPDFGIPDTFMQSLNLRLIVESNMVFAGELVELTYRNLNHTKNIIIRKNEFIHNFKNGTEDEQRTAVSALKKLIISIIDTVELNLILRQYSLRHRLEGEKSQTKFIFNLLKKYRREPHFTIYSINKLIEFKPNEIFDKKTWTIYISEISETTALLKSNLIQVPDDEMRFFIDRMLKNTSDIESYKDLLSTFRLFIKNTERNKILHAMLQEHALNNRHASALLSFFYAAKFEFTYGNQITLSNIEEIANRLGYTYSVTRRFKLSKFLEDLLDTGKIKGQSLKHLQNLGYFTLVIANLINQKELEYALDQYIDVSLFFSDYDINTPRSIYIKRLVSELYSTIKKIVLTKFTDQINDTDGIDEIEQVLYKHEVSIYAQTKIIVALTRELDSRRLDQTVKNITRDEVSKLIGRFVHDAQEQYEAEKETRNINIADLYIQVQHYSMRVSVVLGEIRKNYNKMIKALRNAENFSEVAMIPVILGGIAVAHREQNLNFERDGLFNIIDKIRESSDFYQAIIIDSIDAKHGNIEVKDEMGKTRKIFHKKFNVTNNLIRAFDKTVLSEIFINVLMIDLLMEVSDALISSRNMAKNSVELKTALDDIFNRSSELLEYSEKEYDRIMEVETSI